MSTLHVSINTHRRVLLQLAALEDVVADNQQGTDETGHIKSAQAGEAGVQHGRGEIAVTPVRGRQRHRSTTSVADGLGCEPRIENEKNKPSGKPTRRVRNKNKSKNKNNNNNNAVN